MSKMNTRGILLMYLKDNIFSLRYLASLLFVMSYYFPQLIKIRESLSQESSRMNIAFLCFFVTDSLNLFVFFLGWLIVISNLPFFNHLQLQLLLRLGKKRWLLMQIIYLISMTMIYSLFVFGLLLLSLIGYIGFFPRWGQILLSMGRGISSVEQAVSIPQFILTDYQWGEYMLKFSLMFFTVLFLFSLLMFVGNLCYKRLGFFLSGILLFFSFFAESYGGYTLYYFSPISWVSFHNIGHTQSSNLPDWRYILIGLAILFLVEIIVLILKGRNKGQLEF